MEILKKVACSCRVRQTIAAAIPLFVACVVIGNATSAAADNGSFDKLQEAGRKCNSLTVRKAYNDAAASCEAEATGLQRMAREKNMPNETASSLFLASAFAYGFQSYALAHAGSNTKSKDAFTMGEATLRAVMMTPGCQTCVKRATDALRQYGTWPVTEERRFKQ